MMYQSQNKSYQRLRCKINKWKIKGDFLILNNTSEHVNLVQLIGIVGGFNHAVIISVN